MTASRTFLALAALATLTGIAGDAQAQSRRVRDACDQICFRQPKAQCYQLCFERDGNRLVSLPPPPRRVQPVSVQSPDWRSTVFVSPSNGGRGNTGGNGGGGAGNAGGGAGRSAN